MQKEKFHEINGGTFFLSEYHLVSLRGASAKQFWDGLERLDTKLQELNIGNKNFED